MERVVSFSTKGCEKRYCLTGLHTPLSEIDAAWVEEIEQRVAAFDRGEIPSYAAKDVLVEAHRILK